MLNQKQIENMLIKASEGVEKYFGEENSRFVGMELEYNLVKRVFPTAKFLIYRSWEVTILISDIERGGTMTYGVNVGGDYNLKILVPYKVSERISFDNWSEDIQESLEVLDEYLIWRMTDAQKKTFGIPLDKEVLKED
jgi:complete genome